MHCTLVMQYRERIIFLGKAIDEETGNQLVATMLYLDSENKKDLNLYINCSGGDVSIAELLALVLIMLDWSLSANACLAAAARAQHQKSGAMLESLHLSWPKAQITQPRHGPPTIGCLRAYGDSNNCSNDEHGNTL